MKGLRRLAFVVIVGLLVAAIPVSATASEDILRTSVHQAENQFNSSLTHAIATGMDPVRADQLMWRYSQISSQRFTWWQAPAVQHHQLDQLTLLQADLQSDYQASVDQQRDAFLRALHHWSELLAEARRGGVSTDGLDETRLRFTYYGQLASSPNEYAQTAAALGIETSLLTDRLSSYRSNRSAAQLALAGAQAALANAAQYAQLSLGGFQAQISQAALDLAAVHSPDGFAPIQDRLHQTAIAIQGLLNARSAAYSQLSDTQATLASAQSVGAAIGGMAGTISNLAGQLTVAGDQGTFQSIQAQLAQQKQALANAIYLKQVASMTPTNIAGKVIVVSLARQTLVAYQDGRAVLTTYITTGRPALPTPPGTYHIFAKYSPYQMISPWPYGSPYWYPNSWVTFAMEFIGGGYFIHDAPWRSWYGPGSNIYNGTHGCVNVPYSPMAFLWNWAPRGTTVIVQ